MQPLFEHRLELAGYETRALELEGDGPPLLLLHGYSDSADTWRLLLDRLAPGRPARAGARPARASAPPTASTRASRSCPSSTASRPPRWSGSAPRAAVVCGNSLGGCVALRLAERARLRPGRGRAGGPGRARHGALVRGDRARPAAARAAGRAACRSRAPRCSGVVGEVYKRLAFHRPGDVDPLVASAFASHFADRAVTGAAAGAPAGGCCPSCATRSSLERIGCPVLLVWGART